MIALPVRKLVGPARQLNAMGCNFNHIQLSISRCFLLPFSDFSRPMPEQQMREFDFRYRTADKIYRSVVSSKELPKPEEQCLLHLEDIKGNYCRTTNRM